MKETKLLLGASIIVIVGLGILLVQAIATVGVVCSAPANAVVAAECVQ